MKQAAAALFTAQLVDTASLLVLFFAFRSPVVESNPLVLTLYARFGIVMAAAIKMGLVGLVTLWAVKTSTVHRRVGTILVLAGTLSGVVGAFTNISAIVGVFGGS
jgi:hypothetical protein